MEFTYLLVLIRRHYGLFVHFIHFIRLSLPIFTMQICGVFCFLSSTYLCSYILQLSYPITLSRAFTNHLQTISLKDLHIYYYPLDRSLLIIHWNIFILTYFNLISYLPQTLRDKTWQQGMRHTACRGLCFSLRQR